MVGGVEVFPKHLIVCFQLIVLREDVCNGEFERKFSISLTDLSDAVDEQSCHNNATCCCYRSEY